MFVELYRNIMVSHLTCLVSFSLGPTDALRSPSLGSEYSMGVPKQSKRCYPSFWRDSGLASSMCRVSSVASSRVSTHVSQPHSSLCNNRALSRSTRHWSSYAGYLREIPQMCFTLQRWKDIGELAFCILTAIQNKKRREIKEES